jgi:hypothetical protein
MRFFKQLLGKSENTQPSVEQEPALPVKQQADDESLNCGNCGVNVLTEVQVEEEMGKLGVRYAPNSLISNPYHVSQASFDAIEGKKGFRCQRCRRVFCMNCVLRLAAQHPQGGRACLSCAGQYERLY